MQIKENEVYNCDCLELMREMVKQGIVVDWLITDPPYGINVNHNIGRRFIGAELDKEYFNKGQERLNKVKAQISMFDS